MADPATPRKVKLGIVAPGHFKRLGAQVGFLHAMFDENRENGFPKPEYMTGVSAGGIAIACAAQDAEEDFKKTEEVLINLRGRDFYGINPDLKIWAWLLCFVAFSVLVPIHKIDWWFYQTVCYLFLVIVVFVIEEKFIEKLLKCNSIFSNRNLYNLLVSHLNFKHIWSSPIKIEVASADINTGSYSVVTNFKTEHQNNEIFTQGVVDSTNLPVFFGFRENEEGHFMADGAAISNEPIILAREFGCDVIIVLRFKSLDEHYTSKKFNIWGLGLQKFIDTLVDRIAVKVQRNYERFNHDIEERKKLNRALKVIESCLSGLPEDKNTEEVKKAIETAKNIKLSCDSRRKIEFIYIEDEILPFHFSSFKKDDNLENIERGKRAFRRTKDQILDTIAKVSGESED